MKRAMPSWRGSAIFTQWWKIAIRPSNPQPLTFLIARRTSLHPRSYSSSMGSQRRRRKNPLAFWCPSISAKNTERPYIRRCAGMFRTTGGPVPSLCLTPRNLSPVMDSGPRFDGIAHRRGFTEIFGEINWPLVFTPDHPVGAMIPINGRKMSGKQMISLKDLNGDTHECIAEAFTQTYQVFILIHAVSTLTGSSILMPGISKN